MYKLYHGAEVYMDYICTRAHMFLRAAKPPGHCLYYIILYYIIYFRLVVYIVIVTGTVYMPARLLSRTVKMMPLSQFISFTVIGLSRISSLTNESSVRRNQIYRDGSSCTVFFSCIAVTS